MAVEPYGLGAVPREERTATWKDMLYIWSGNSFCIPSFIIGAILIPTFSWGEAQSINLLGNLAVGCLIVLGGCFGAGTGLPAVVFGKRVFGERLGHLVPTACLLISTLGWFAVITAITGQALDEIIKINTGYSNPILFTALTGALNSYAAVQGFGGIRRYSRYAFPVLCLFCLWVAVHLMAGHPGGINLEFQKTGTLNYWQGIDLVAGGYIAGALAASDFSRYTTGSRPGWIGVLPGTFLVSAILGVIGMLLNVLTGEWNPVREVQGFGLGLPALACLFIANWTTNYNLLYSSGLAATNILPGLSRWKNTLGCGAAGTILALAGIADHLQEMLSLLALLLSPVLGVMLTDFFARRRLKEGEPPGRPDLNLPALAAVLAGCIFALVFSGAAGSTITGLAASSASYLLFRAIRAGIAFKRIAGPGQKKNHLEG